LHGDALTAVAELKQSAGTDLVIMGSGVLIRSLMAADLIDEYLLTIAPLVLGSGRRMFNDGVRTSLRLTDSDHREGRDRRNLRDGLKARPRPQPPESKKPLD
jgi:dihydrofolate reductase